MNGFVEVVICIHCSVTLPIRIKKLVLLIIMSAEPSDSFVNDESSLVEGKKLVGRRYEGGWRDGRYEGVGIFLSGNGDSYSGDFNSGCLL